MSRCWVVTLTRQLHDKKAREETQSATVLSENVPGVFEEEPGHERSWGRGSWGDRQEMKPEALGLGSTEPDLQKSSGKTLGSCTC